MIYMPSLSVMLLSMERENNQKQIERIKELVSRNLRKILHKGYYGEATFQIQVQDGAIQSIEESIKEKHQI